MPDSDFADRKPIVTKIRNGFEELSALMAQLQRCLAKREHTRHTLERAARALLQASESSDLARSRRFLADALDAAREGLSEIDRPQAAPTAAREMETAAD